MNLYLARMIITSFISATLLAQCGLSQEQQIDNSLVVAVLDVQKVLNSMPELQREANATDANAAGVQLRSSEASEQTEADARLNAYKKIRMAAAEVAESGSIQLVMKADTAGLLDGDPLTVEQVGNADKSKIIYRENMDLTRDVIKHLQRSNEKLPLKAVRNNEKPNQLIGVIDVERVQDARHCCSRNWRH